MENNKRGFVSIEVGIVFAVILCAGLVGVSYLNDSKTNTTNTFENTINGMQYGDDIPEVVPPEEVVNQKPRIHGVGDVTIEFNSEFNALYGVTANDKEDGDLTSKIVVQGVVITNVAGDYYLRYSVVDSSGAEALAARKVTVKPQELVGDPIKPDWDFDANYEVKDVVHYQGKYYKPKWSSTGSGEPGVDEIWVEVQMTADGFVIWNAQAVFVTGDIVHYDGKHYKARHWTQGATPGTVWDWEEL